MEQLLSSTFFAMITMGGLVGTIFMFLLGELFEHDHDHDGDTDGDSHGLRSFLSVRMLLLFITGFGIGGFILTQAGAGALLRSVGALIGGAAFGWLGTAVLRFFHNSQANSAAAASDIVGRIGVVTLTIPFDGVGEVVVHYGTNEARYPASAREFIGVGTEVLITGKAGFRLLVEKFEVTKKEIELGVN